MKHACVCVCVYIDKRALLHCVIRCSLFATVCCQENNGYGWDNADGVYDGAWRWGTRRVRNIEVTMPPASTPSQDKNTRTQTARIGFSQSRLHRVHFVVEHEHASLFHIFTFFSCSVPLFLYTFGCCCYPLLSPFVLFSQCLKFV